MMKKISIALAGLLAVMITGVAASPAYANVYNTTTCTGPGSSGSDPRCKEGSTTQGETSVKKLIGTITEVLFFVLGTISVIAIIYGGIRYVLSGGDASHVKAAKDIILYAVVGLIVALLAYGIVAFVLDRF